MTGDESGRRRGRVSEAEARLGGVHECVVNNLTINTRGEGFKAVQTYDVYHLLRMCVCVVSPLQLSHQIHCVSAISSRRLSCCVI